MRWSFSKLQLSSLFVMFLTIAILTAEGPLPGNVEDYYGEWKLDKVMRTGWGTSYTEETLVDKFSFSILIGKEIRFEPPMFDEGITWRIDSFSLYEGRSGYLRPIIPTENFSIELTGSRVCQKDRYRYVVSVPGYLSFYHDGWFLFYKKVVEDRTTDFANPYIENLYGNWEVFEIENFASTCFIREDIESLFASPIEFTRYRYSDHKNESHTVVFEMDAPSNPGPFENSFWKLPDSVQANLGVVTQFTLFSDEGYVLNRLELSESGILCDYFDGWFIYYKKQPPPPLKKQGAQP